MKNAAGRFAPPDPGRAPWAPHIVYAPLPRWPYVIPLALLAALAGSVWLLLARGLLPDIGPLAGGL